MALTAQQLFDLWSGGMKDAELGGDGFGLTKTDLKAAMSALDGYFDANATTINQAIPQPARGALTVRQKTILVGLVAFKRARVA